MVIYGCFLVYYMVLFTISGHGDIFDIVEYMSIMEKGNAKTWNDVEKNMQALSSEELAEIEL
jgi:hypothetical protein